MAGQEIASRAECTTEAKCLPLLLSHALAVDATLANRNHGDSSPSFPWARGVDGTRHRCKAFPHPVGRTDSFSPDCPAFDTLRGPRCSSMSVRGERGQICSAKMITRS